MALVLADRVKETTTSTGTTAITLAGAATGYQTFLSAVGNANTTYYTIADQTGTNWEVGIGTYTTSGNTLSRDTVLSSSNAGSLVTFTAGTKDVFVTYPAGKATYQGGTFSLVAGSNVTITGTWPNQTIAASSGGSATKTISNKTAAYTVVAGDLGTIINCTSGTFNVSLTAAASLGSGFTCTIWNTGTGAITIDPAGAETIDGIATRILRAGEGTDIVCDGTNWQTSYKKTMRGYAENMQSTITRPVASGTNAIALGNTASSAGSNAIALGFTSSANGTFGIAIGYNTSAGIGDYSTSISSNSAGGGSVTATGAGAMALGGSYASGTDSFAAAVGNNTSTYGAQSTSSISIGKTAKSTGANSTALGEANIASGSNSFAAGYGSNASGVGSISMGYYGSSASGIGSFAFGQYAKSGQDAKYSYAAGRFAATGDAQYGQMVLRAATTTTVAVVLTSDAAAAGTTNQLIVASNQAMAISGTLIAKQSASGNMAGWTITGIVSNNAGTMAVSGLSLTAIGTDSIGLGAAPTIAVDNTNKGVTITSGYKAATNIRWVANVQTSEVTYS